MIIGKFRQEGEEYIGNLFGIGFGAQCVVFSPLSAKSSGKGPDFAVNARLYEEGDFEIGAAWAKTSKAGKPYLSVKLDSPALVEPINCALTRQQDGSHALVWNRDARKDEEQAAT
jgi:uncharacterized protein (DUF736 family)